MPIGHAHQMILRNTSGATRFFGYIGRLGVTLANGADVAVTGNIWEVHSRNKRLIDSFNNDLLNGEIEILKTTDTFVYDATDDLVWVLAADNSAPSLAEPAYGSYTGPSPDVD